jgi:hypothetical protein
MLHFELEPGNPDFRGYVRYPKLRGLGSRVHKGVTRPL